MEALGYKLLVILALWPVAQFLFIFRLLDLIMARRYRTQDYKKRMYEFKSSLISSIPLSDELPEIEGFGLSVEVLPFRTFHA